MNHPRDWKWKIAVVGFVIITAVVIFYPLPDPPPPPPPPPKTIPTVKPAARELPPDEDLLYYTIQEGDIAESIARLFVVNLDDLLDLNHLAPNDHLTPGLQILIPPSTLYSPAVSSRWSLAVSWIPEFRFILTWKLNIGHWILNIESSPHPPSFPHP